MPLTLPYTFDTSDVWRTILKGAIGLVALVTLLALVSLALGRWPAALALSVCGVLLFFFARILIRFQTGSAGTLSAERVVVEPKRLLWFSLPGPFGTYELQRFSAVRVEFQMGPIDPGVQGGPNELVWLVGRPGTPDIVLARTDDGAGRRLGEEFGAALGLPVEEKGAPKVIRL
jgi:hypothetical protein